MARPRLLLIAAALGLAPMTPLHARDALVDLHYLKLDEADLGAARMDGFETGLRVHSPWFSLGNGRFGIGGDYLYTHYGYEGLPTRNRDLHRLAVPLDWSIGERTVVTVTATPTVATSSNVFKDLFSRGGSDDFNLYGAATVERAPDNGWGWRLGAGYDDRFGDPQAYPIATALYRQPQVELELGWPQLRTTWKPHERWHFGLHVAPAGARWHVVSDERDGADFDYTVEAWRASLNATWSFASRWQLALQLGSEFDRHHDFEDDTGARVDEDVGDAAFAAVAIRYRFAQETTAP